MPVLLFVYGTLRQGLPNHDRMVGRRVGGIWRTVQALPLYVVRLPLEDRAPWLMNQPGQGHRVLGEVYEVDADLLPAMDRFEEVGLPTGYERVAIDLEPADHDGPRLCAQAYLKPASHLAQCAAVEGPFAEYTAELARGYWLELAAGHLHTSPMTDTFDPVPFVQRQLDAYNARDLERFVREYTDDVTAWRLPDAQPVLVGKAAFAEHYRSRRFNLPGLHAQVVNRMVFGNKVIDHERVVGVQATPMDVAAIYEVTPAGISRVWFVSGD